MYAMEKVFEMSATFKWLRIVAMAVFCDGHEIYRIKSRNILNACTRLSYPDCLY